MFGVGWCAGYERHAFRSEIEPAYNHYRFVLAHFAYTCTAQFATPRASGNLLIRFLNPISSVAWNAPWKLGNEMRCLVSHSESTPRGGELRVAKEVRATVVIEFVCSLLTAATYSVDDSWEGRRLGDRIL